MGKLVEQPSLKEYYRIRFKQDFPLGENLLDDLPLNSENVSAIKWLSSFQLEYQDYKMVADLWRHLNIGKEIYRIKTPANEKMHCNEWFFVFDPQDVYSKPQRESPIQLGRFYLFDNDKIKLGRAEDLFAYLKTSRPDLNDSDCFSLTQILGALNADFYLRSVLYGFVYSNQDRTFVPQDPSSQKVFYDNWKTSVEAKVFIHMLKNDSDFQHHRSWLYSDGLAQLLAANIKNTDIDINQIRAFSKLKNEDKRKYSAVNDHVGEKLRNLFCRSYLQLSISYSQALIQFANFKALAADQKAD
jgi:hypothetical protein